MGKDTYLMGKECYYRMGRDSKYLKPDGNGQLLQDWERQLIPKMIETDNYDWMGKDI